MAEVIDVFIEITTGATIIGKVIRDMTATMMIAMREEKMDVEIMVIEEVEMKVEEIVVATEGMIVATEAMVEVNHLMIKDN